MKHFSILDLAPIAEGQSVRDAIGNSVDLARHAEKLGYHRFWLAEHHNSPGIASAATALVIGHVAQHTSTIRMGAGGIMLPNHSPLTIAEQFGTLASLYPDRIDLGLGRAPGTDGHTARALRRHMGAREDDFPNDVVELINYFGDMPDQSPVRAIPGVGTHVPVWILGSSLYGAQLAAYLGLPYAFASHFAPTHLDEAIATYRATFRPSEILERPHVMIGVGMCAADTDEEAHFLRSSQILTFARLYSGKSGAFPQPVKDVSAEVPPHILDQVLQSLSCSAVGSPATVERQMRALLDRYQPDEVIIAGMIHSHEARMHSATLAAEVLHKLKS